MKHKLGSAHLKKILVYRCFLNESHPSSLKHITLLLENIHIQLFHNTFRMMQISPVLKYVLHLFIFSSSFFSSLSEFHTSFHNKEKYYLPQTIIQVGALSINPCKWNIF